MDLECAREVLCQRLHRCLCFSNMLLDKTAAVKRCSAKFSNSQCYTRQSDFQALNSAVQVMSKYHCAHARCNSVQVSHQSSADCDVPRIDRADAYHPCLPCVSFVDLACMSRKLHAFMSNAVSAVYWCTVPTASTSMQDYDEFKGCVTAWGIKACELCLVGTDAAVKVHTSCQMHAQSGA